MTLKQIIKEKAAHILLLLQEERRRLREEIENSMGSIKHLQHRCPQCGKETKTPMTYLESFRINALWGRCFECVSKDKNTGQLETKTQTKLEKLIKEGKYAYVDLNINDKNFPDFDKLPNEKTELIHFDKVMSSEQVLVELKTKGYRPANLKELLEFGKANSEKQKEYPIIAFGSVWQDWSSYRVVIAGGRYLELGWFGHEWRESCRFLAVRESDKEHSNECFRERSNQRTITVTGGNGLAATGTRSNYFEIVDDPKISTSQILAEMREKFQISVYDEENLDKNFPPPTKKTVRYFKKNIEADEENAIKSANDSGEEELKNGITLRERLLMELEYFNETNKHLDTKNNTFCSGSRYSDGSVPGVAWNSFCSEVCAGFRLPARVSSLRGPRAVLFSRGRQAVSLNTFDLEDEILKEKFMNKCKSCIYGSLGRCINCEGKDK